MQRPDLLLYNADTLLDEAQPGPHLLQRSTPSFSLHRLSMSDHALILVNLGSTPSTQVKDVRQYLNQFLMDRYVIDLPWPIRRMLVSLILRSRPAASAAAYQSIWWPEGSPLLVISERLRAKLAEQWAGAPVKLAMRYGQPSIQSILQDLAKDGIKTATLVPLYPQFADSTVTTVLDEARRTIRQQALPLRLDVIPPFFDQPDYMAALAASIRPSLASAYDHLLLSYHGLPERHIRKADPSGCHCLATADCCQTASDEILGSCYRAQCVRTSAQLAAALGIPDGQWSMSFQSRLGKAKWIEPYTDETLKKLGQQGVKHLLVACPAFVADCIETLEEIGIRGKETFREAGGEELTLIPCLNDQPHWVSTLAKICRQAPRQPLGKA
jgi:ferrochelatase